MVKFLQQFRAIPSAFFPLLSCAHNTKPFIKWPSKEKQLLYFLLKEFETLHDPKIGIPTVTRARRTSSMEIGETNRARHKLTHLKQNVFKVMTLSEYFLAWQEEKKIPISGALRRRRKKLTTLHTPSALLCTFLLRGFLSTRKTYPIKYIHCQNKSTM